MPYANEEDERAWDRKRNATSPKRIFQNSIGRYKRAIRARINAKQDRLAKLESELEDYLHAKEKRSRNEAAGDH